MDIALLNLAVVGPVARQFLSVAGSCESCGIARSPGGSASCRGFGPGCLAASRGDLRDSSRPTPTQPR